MSRPVLALYLRVPAPNNALHGILIGVDTGTHDQLTRCGTSRQRETDSRNPLNVRAPMIAFLEDGSLQNDRHPGHRWPCQL